jgi:hypothetical protein
MRRFPMTNNKLSVEQIRLMREHFSRPVPVENRRYTDEKLVELCDGALSAYEENKKLILEIKNLLDKEGS